MRLVTGPMAGGGALSRRHSLSSHRTCPHSPKDMADNFRKSTSQLFFDSGRAFQLTARPRCQYGDPYSNTSRTTTKPLCTSASRTFASFSSQFRRDNQTGHNVTANRSQLLVGHTQRIGENSLLVSVKRDDVGHDEVGSIVPRLRERILESVVRSGRKIGCHQNSVQRNFRRRYSLDHNL